MTSGLFVVLQKEFVDQLTNRRFLTIFALFLIISVIGVHDGADQYNNMLASYAQRMQSISSDTQIPGYMPEIPSSLIIFTKMTDYFVMFGVFLGIAMGFDLISKEKETRSLRTLLSHPVFRDEIVNGKAIASALVLAIALGATIAVSVAILLIMGIIPTADELCAILLFAGISTMFVLTYFSLALMMSTVAPDSGTALISTLAIFLLLSSAVPILGWTAAEMIAGSPPTLPADAQGSHYISKNIDSSEFEQYEREMQSYWEGRAAASSLINLLSPNVNYQKTALAVTDPKIAVTMDNNPYSFVEGPPETQPGLDEILDRIWANVVALIALPCVFFSAAYVTFMRMDIR
ncbi:ABC transporter permease [Methanoculleus thermophilus]|uniref:ABC transporter permease n=1 Tax=Methanoculleus thermophilus TaxID=2200 RepID=UPI0009F82F03|nr:ABC transporter permease subunit [Methanoculleus thermophilus]